MKGLVLYKRRDERPDQLVAMRVYGQALGCSDNASAGAGRCSSDGKALVRPIEMAGGYVRWVTDHSAIYQTAARVKCEDNLLDQQIPP